MKEEVCAVVVTFRPGSETLRNLALVRAQAAGLIVVDNGSSQTMIQALREASRSERFTLIENETNLGIAAALNRGIGHARDGGYQWVLLLDQDSTVTEGFVGAMIDGARRSLRAKVAVFCPRYIDSSSGETMPTPLHRGDGPEVARTSGSLMPMWAFEECGWFREELFIDQVDFEYCLRLRARGYQIAECEGATLLHTLGAPKIYSLFGRRLFGTTNHSAARRYYLARNRIWLLKNYWGRYPYWCAAACIATLKESLRILLVEDGRWSKLGRTALGVRDGLLGRMGKRVEI